MKRAQGTEQLKEENALEWIGLFFLALKSIKDIDGTEQKNVIDPCFCV